MAISSNGEFLGKIKIALDGKEQVVSGLNQIDQSMKKLTSTKVITTFDKSGLVTGKQIEETFKDIGNATDKAKTKGNDFINAMRRAVIVAPVWMALRSVMVSIQKLFQEQIKFLVEMETAMAHIQIVGKGTAEEYDHMKIALIGLAQAYGSTASEALEASKTFCFDDKTEIFTDKGWKYFKDLDKTEKVWSWDLDLGSQSFQEVSAYIDEPYSGEMYLYDTPKMNFCVTPNHNMICQLNYRKNNKYIFKKIENIGSAERIKKSIEWSGINQNYTDDFIQFLGWFISEGYIHKTNEVVIYQKNSDNVDNICFLFNKLGYKYHISTDKRNNCKAIGCNNTELADFLRKNCYIGVNYNSHTKCIPSFLKSADSRQIKVFLNTFVKGDGQKMSTNVNCYFTSSKNLSNDLQELILKSGNYAYLYSRYSGFKNSLGYCIIESLSKDFLMLKKRLKKIKYNGRIYCVTTKYNSIYVRRSGRCHWSGNSQQGRTVAESIQLTKIAMIGAQILGTDIKTTVNNLTAAVEGFNIPVENSIMIIDKWINVERQFAVTAQDLADATKTTGAAANQLGVSIDAFLGHITSIIEVTRKSGTAAGNALNFMYARFYTIAKKTIESITKIPFYLDATGKATNEVKKDYRSITDILDDLSGVWVTLTEKQKFDIAQSVASKKQMTPFLALMQNYNHALLARVEALASAGQSERALSIITETTVYKMKQLASTWNLLTVVMGDTGVFKSTLDSLNGLVSGFVTLINSYKVYQAELTKGYAKEKTLVDTQKSEIANFRELLKIRKSLSKAKQTPENVEALNLVNENIEKMQNKSPLLLNIDTSDIDVVNNKLDELSKVISTKEIVINVIAKYQPKREQLEKEREAFRKEAEFREGTGLLKGVGKQLPLAKEARAGEAEKQKELNELDKLQSEEINKQVREKKKKNDLLNQAKELQKIELQYANDLTEKEEEQISIATKLGVEKNRGQKSTSELLELEKQLVKESKFVYDEHEKNLKLSELESQITIEKQGEANELAKTQIGVRSDILRLLGAEESQIIKNEMVSKSILLGEGYLKTIMVDKLRLAEALTKEMDNQNKKSAYLVELWKISKKYGKDVAQEVSAFIANMKPIEELSTTARRIVKSENKNLYEEALASRYFSEQRTPNIYGQQQSKRARELYEKNLEGRVYNPNLKNQLIFPEKYAEERNKQIINRVIGVNVAPVKVEVKVNDAEMIMEKTKKEINKALSDKLSELSRKIDEKIEEH